MLTTGIKATNFSYIEINHNMVYYQRENVIFLLQHQKRKLEIV